MKTTRIEQAFELLQQLTPEEQQELFAAIRQQRAGDKAALKRLVEKSEKELNDLRTRLLQGKTPEEFSQSLIDEINGGDA